MALVITPPLHSEHHQPGMDLPDITFEKLLNLITVRSACQSPFSSLHRTAGFMATPARKPAVRPHLRCVYPHVHRGVLRGQPGVLQPRAQATSSLLYHAMFQRFRDGSASAMIHRLSLRLFVICISLALSLLSGCSSLPSSCLSLSATYFCPSLHLVRWFPLV
jgi:hypothetical protein